MSLIISNVYGAFCEYSNKFAVSSKPHLTKILEVSLRIFKIISIISFGSIVGAILLVVGVSSKLDPFAYHPNIDSIIRSSMIFGGVIGALFGAIYAFD